MEKEGGSFAWSFCYDQVGWIWVFWSIFFFFLFFDVFGYHCLMRP